MDRRERRCLELIRELGVPGAGATGEIDPSARLEALGIDSLAFAELALALEDELGVRIDDAAPDASASVADVLEGVRAAGPAPRVVRLAASVGRWQGAADALGGWALRWWLDLRVEGAERVPERGPAVLAMNHESALDIPVAVLACPRRIAFMAKRELFKGPLTSWALDRLGGFPVERARFDLRAVRLALDVLARGGVLGMYPEGTRSPGELLPFLQGSAWLALRTGAPLVPTAMLGTERARDATRPRRCRVRVRFGEPIPVAPVREARGRRVRAAELTQQLRARMERLLALS